MLDALRCGSWLVYATRAEKSNAVRVRNIVIYVKRDQVDADSRRLYADIVVDRMAASPGCLALELFGQDVSLVPVPGASLTRPNTVWPALSICNALRNAGLGGSVDKVLRRITAVPKSAVSQNRPTFDQHYQSFSVQGTLNNPLRLLVWTMW